MDTSGDELRVAAPTKTLEEQAYLVAQLRAELQASQELAIKLTDQLEATDIYQALESVRQAAKQTSTWLDLAEASLRLMITAAYSETGIRSYPMGEIKIAHEISYRDQDAVEWAIKCNPSKYLLINKRVFEKDAVTLDLDFVSVCDKPKGYIKSDLTSFLPEGSEWLPKPPQP